MVTISEIELAEKIRKGQFKTGKLGGCRASILDGARRLTPLGASNVEKPSQHPPWLEFAPEPQYSRLK